MEMAVSRAEDAIVQDQSLCCIRKQIYVKMLQLFVGPKLNRLFLDFLQPMPHVDNDSAMLS